MAWAHGRARAVGLAGFARNGQWIVGVTSPWAKAAPLQGWRVIEHSLAAGMTRICNILRGLGDFVNGAVGNEYPPITG